MCRTDGLVVKSMLLPGSTEQVSFFVRRQREGGIAVSVTGARGCCPACRAALWVPASELLGEWRCPRCGADLWVVVFSRGPVFFPRRPGESLADLLAALGGPTLGNC